MTFSTKHSMRPRGRRMARAALGVAVAALAAELMVASRLPARSDGPDRRTVVSSHDDDGVLTSVFLNGQTFDRSNPFFQSLGTNGRACSTCHAPKDAWGLTPATAQAIFNASGGLDPLFHDNDGANSPLADMSTVAARRAACSMMLTKALVRVGMPIPAGAEFELVGCDDPYGFASASELSLFRRPLPAANLPFLTTVMWDGRETVSPFLTTNTQAQNRAALLADLRSQAFDAIMGHAQASTPPTDAQLDAIVAFEVNIATAQSHAHGIGRLDVLGGHGGPFALALQPFYVGINDALGGDPITHSFDPSAMRLYTAWLHSPDPHKASVARGEALFNTKPIEITGVAGLNDTLHVTTIHGTCSTCHDTPNVANHSVGLPINIGISDASRRTPDLPLYTLRNKTTGETVQTTDPGRALVTGKWADIGKFKGPILRGLAARAPYFHNGSAATLGDAVDFYDTRFGIGFTPQEKADLVAFLKTL